MEARGGPARAQVPISVDSAGTAACVGIGRTESRTGQIGFGDEWRNQRTVELVRRTRDVSLSEPERRECFDLAVQLNLSIAESLARRYRSHGEDLDDLIQVARLGLIHAIARFRPEVGEFVSFAVPTIAGEIKRHFRDHFWSVPRPPRRLQDLRHEVSAAWSQLAQEQGHAPSAAEIAARLGMDRDEVSEAMSTTPFNFASLDASDGTGPSNDLIGAPDPGFEGVEDALEHAELMKRLRPAIAELSEEDRLILRMRFGENSTQSMIAAELGVSQMSVSRRLTRITRRLRQRARCPVRLHGEPAQGFPRRSTGMSA